MGGLWDGDVVVMGWFGCIACFISSRIRCLEESGRKR